MCRDNVLQRMYCRVCLIHIIITYLLNSIGLLRSKEHAFQHMMRSIVLDSYPVPLLCHSKSFVGMSHIISHSAQQAIPRGKGRKVRAIVPIARRRQSRGHDDECGGILRHHVPWRRRVPFIRANDQEYFGRYSVVAGRVVVNLHRP